MASGEVRLPKFLRREAGVEVDRLYRRYADEVFRYALMVMRSRPDAEDITQTVFIRALRAVERGEKVRTPRNWLIKIAHNECRRLLASRKVHVELPEEIAVEPVERPDVAELRTAMAGLPEAQRKALCLRELEGRTYVEIASELDLTVSAVETLIFRARRTLREQIEAAISCQDFALLLDDPSARARIRAHARVCSECATLERQARGRKSALKRIASMLGLPWWGTKLAAVGLTAAAVAASAASVHALVPHHGARSHASTPSKVAPGPVVAPHSTKVSGTPRVSGTGATGRMPHARAAAAGSVTRRSAPGAPTPLPQPAPEPPAPSLPPAAQAPAEAAAASPSSASATAALPTPAPVAIPSVAPPAVTVSTPVVSTPAVPVAPPPVETPPVTVPAVTTPVATTPAVTVPSVTVSVPTATVPSVTTTITTPNVRLP